MGRSPEDVGALVGELRADGLRGVNVTHPCKQLAVPHLDSLSRQAEALGAVNTVVFDAGHATGHNTDWPGFAEGFRRGLPGAAVGDVLLVGAGGAGSAVARAALELGVRRLHILDEDARRARELAASLDERASVGRDPAELLSRADGLIHATPTGMAGDSATAVDPQLLRPEMWVADIVYRPLTTPLLAAAQERGCATLDGGRMAVFQAVYAFQLFTGAEPDPDRMLAHFAELTAREAAWTGA